jgi:tRNA A37 methylthiotransferase MiaB
MKGLGGTKKKERSKAMSELKREICTEAHEAMVGETHEVLVVEEGTGDSVKCRDEAYRQVILTDTAERGIEIGDVLEVEITAHEAMYCFGEPLGTRRKQPAGRV